MPYGGVILAPQPRRALNLRRLINLGLTRTNDTWTITPARA
ncbi:hypothetical protein [Streptomyces sp. A3M-1-3]|nr:hypothetical protein [Streptomyces sp. A3M-1-3]